VGSWLSAGGLVRAGAHKQAAQQRQHSDNRRGVACRTLQPHALVEPAWAQACCAGPARQATELAGVLLNMTANKGCQKLACSTASRHWMHPHTC
jgi:hypothetical protein